MQRATLQQSVTTLAGAVLQLRGALVFGPMNIIATANLLRFSRHYRLECHRQLTTKQQSFTTTLAESVRAHRARKVWISNGRSSLGSAGSAMSMTSAQM